MRYNLKRPCKECPFRTDCGGYLSKSRAKEIGEALVHGGKTFACHKTTVPIDNENSETDMTTTLDSQHCAGALIMMEKMGVAPQNQMIRIAERLGFYNHEELDMESPIVADLRALVKLHRG